MNDKVYKKILFMFLLFLSLLSFNEVGWCAGQEKVVFINERKQFDGSYSIYGEYDIYIVNSDGTGLKKLIENGINPVPSPDGKRIAFIPTRILEDHLGLSIINVDGTGRKDLIKKKEEENIGFCCLRWSPDSKKLAYMSNFGKKGKKGASLWVIDIATGARKEIYEGIEEIPVTSWSPDGGEILLLLPGLQPGPQPSRPEYVIINIKTGDNTRLEIQKINKAFIPILILDKKRLIYYKNDALWVVNRDGNNNKKLVTAGSLSELLPLRFGFEIMANKIIRINTNTSSEKGIIHGLYEFNLATGILRAIAKTDDKDFLGYFSYDGTKILGVSETRPTYDENELRKGSFLPKPFLYKLYVKDLRSEKEYVLCDSWRTFKQEIVVVYESANWVAPAE